MTKTELVNDLVKYILISLTLLMLPYECLIGYCIFECIRSMYFYRNRYNIIYNIIYIAIFTYLYIMYRQMNIEGNTSITLIW